MVMSHLHFIAALELNSNVLISLCIFFKCRHVQKFQTQLRLDFWVKICFQINTGSNDGYLSGWYANCAVRLTPTADKHHELFG